MNRGFGVIPYNRTGVHIGYKQLHNVVSIGQLVEVILSSRHVKVSALLFSVLLIFAASVTLNSVHAGRWISVHVTGLLPTNRTCSISSPSSPNAVLPGSAACAIQLGTGVAYGGFIVGNVLPGSYVIQVTGDQGDFAQTILSTY